MNKYNPEIHNRRSVRLKGYDYSGEGLYFITICCQNKEHFFGEITNGDIELSDIGRIANQCWKEIPNHFKNVVLHSFVIMPNHIHGIIEIINNDSDSVGENYYSPKNVSPQNGLSKNETAKNDDRAKDISPLPNGTSKTIGSIVRGFKIGVTKWVRVNTDIFQIWQRNYHEHIIKNYESYCKITEYIEKNPLKWEEDCFFVGAKNISPKH
ncbi:MAG: hypothetical protein Q4C98_10230 [Capnocytophaga sp.]|nr:hypothetical protein [Capnocytophaga sp.]